jgi:hypothetical protein
MCKTKNSLLTTAYPKDSCKVSKEKNHTSKPNSTHVCMGDKREETI